MTGQPDMGFPYPVPVTHSDREPLRLPPRFTVSFTGDVVKVANAILQYQDRPLLALHNLLGKLFGTGEVPPELALYGLVVSVEPDMDQGDDADITDAGRALLRRR